MKKTEKKISTKKALFKSGREILNLLPLLFSMLMLIGLISLIPKSLYLKLFNDNFLDPVIGAIIGSISVGNPVTSYILGGEMFLQGISLIAVTAFIITWVTVGVIQLPLEIKTFGKKFAITRNLLSFLIAIIISILVVLVYNFI